MAATLPDVSEVPSLGTDKLRHVLKTLRTLPLRRSPLAVAAGTKVLQSSSLGNERWVILEQLTIAALDTGDLQRAESCIAQLSKQFGEDGKRVSRLRGMLLESEGRFSETRSLLYIRSD
eukprot:TRINITY_DN32492_c0_g1_i2.p1 TRINITY_DN32492_c0_g1~~TRINITY_DN32492_c0_g1_i2.p1  ORF type:complete len:138 (+),score=25.28 TRINITY_DN32492_c0_g1_i2:59-415(+)